jgi:hypothetical protein
MRASVNITEGVVPLAVTKVAMAGFHHNTKD